MIYVAAMKRKTFNDTSFSRFNTVDQCAGQTDRRADIHASYNK